MSCRMMRQILGKEAGHFLPKNLNTELNCCLSESIPNSRILGSGMHNEHAVELGALYH
jgi:hypothetical protein